MHTLGSWLGKKREAVKWNYADALTRELLLDELPRLMGKSG
ncbi:hypothetical protein [Paenibacillus thiaminolyticus]|nr:hypothetical protein [Paenibacillus thiaminolyticus]MEC0065421.1 hypothetical protein [Paenibacillus thiaminolyticus]MEC0101565.1 hypothetical protein [Paenibacillus thiaminolyticus]